MKFTTKVVNSALMLMAGVGASAQECPSGSSLHVVDGVKKCVLDSNIIVIVDPVWVVAGGVALVLLIIITAYLAIKVSQLAKGLEAGRRIG